MTLTPIYGRDYKNKKEVLEALYADKDFLECQSQKPINYSQLTDYSGWLNIRYSQLRKVLVLDFRNGKVR